MFKSVIFNFENNEEFEERWFDLLRLANLWLHQMFEIHDRWVLAYLNHILSASILSSQKPKSSQSFFKRYISKKDSLMNFIIRFNRAISHQWYQELISDHVDLNEQQMLKCSWPMEMEMVKVYIKIIFMLFQKEIFESHAYCVNCISENEELIIYSA